MHIALFIKVIFWIQIMLKKNIFSLFFLESYYFDEQIFYSLILLKQEGQTLDWFAIEN